jgi:integrase
MASARRRGEKFMGLYRDAEGRQRSAGSFAMKKEALKAARAAEAHGFSDHKTEVAHPLKVRGKVTVAWYASEWLPNHPLSPNARYVYEQMLRKHIVPALGGRALADVTAADIRAMFRAYEADNTSKALGAKIKTVLSAMFQTAAEDGLIQANVVRGVRFQAAPPKRRRALSADEWFRVRKCLVGDDWLFAEVQMATGARVEEIRGMETGDVADGMWHVCRVRNQVHGKFITRDTTKTGRDRFIPMDTEIIAKIMERGPGPVFPDVARETYRKHWRRACRAAGLDWYPAPRDLRRTFATLARAGGADLEAVRVALGHTRISTTDQYLGERPETRGEALLAVQKALKGAA